ncbi:acyl-ACP--UDP-N-acetylglucosamine O-acyltransferase [Pseudoalteromonas tunicata]|uniref:Acyl-[acyl-carrier-protein]--UDP-N-acetylglucosamine O-acyltransferase n=1 Tax=Pseudoalteromonas tunicata D2 TaxID=87626 RepID=A4C5Z1_9GAMM|nr:acyl-ACP--UDP-N-acetylglucosamine O-acyltransferase [Pseudoalteromonas tunicata]ATC95368.1 UDP-N-acetylglucosamine acyltransferase [Pseudoalteromonas tunicata]AXT30955.1 acyl-ACP--UDP-N-acetylglucosamine O-acyltransferase [Pseudoalteromonas tunicata]EAR29395.1 UDP-N-acetylglucosamine acyltransferase [Pseudoalteromonas tunicata D2]MDP4984363.1 acyl-ACP--UDP-N-acetylglucosamine O-acyltransferase [Pseudoalteromonas tunicata]
MIHPSAIIEPGAQIGENVSIGPWTYIGNDVVIGDNNIIESHVVIKGPSVIGSGNHIFQFASVGEGCQDKKYNNEPTRLVIGDNNVIRECATIHRGTIQDQGLTQIGSNNLFMAYTHVAHDAMIGSNVIFANNASVAGHVHVGDWVILAGNSGVHQFCKIGDHAFVGMYSGVNKDVPPFVTTIGTPAGPVAINTEGMKRRGFSPEEVMAVRRAYKTLYRKALSLEDALAAMAEDAAAFPAVQTMIDFVARSERGILR